MKENLNRRFCSREVFVGGVGIGKNNPIRLQSMITAPLKEVKLAVDQIIELYLAGSEFVRVAIQNKQDVDFCKEVKEEIFKKLSFMIPLIADVHFYPDAALLIADVVEKVRINPGNFVAFSPKISLQERLERLEEKLFPLIEKCKSKKCAIRLGVNHGSLAPHIAREYKSESAAMIASLFEYAEIFRKYDFHDLVFSLKTSSPFNLIAYYEELVKEMTKKGWDYPLHLGVTEAGRGIEGRIKSAIGIGPLLLNGIGDTIRVSITENPVNELSACRQIVSSVGRLEIPKMQHFNLRTEAPVVLFLGDGKAKIDDKQIDYFLIEQKSPFIVESKSRKAFPLLFLSECKSELAQLDTLREGQFGLLIDCEDEVLWRKIFKITPKLLFASRQSNPFHLKKWLEEKRVKIPLILYLDYEFEGEELFFQSAIETSAYFCHGVGDSIVIKSYKESLSNLKLLTLQLLQGCDRGSFAIEFISCPGCGRTLYDIEGVCTELKAALGHLKGVKIAIMGCIVNGIGEVGEADFGYVGSRNGTIDLYVGKKCVKREIQSKEALSELISLIKAHGRWVDAAETL